MTYLVSSWTGLTVYRQCVEDGTSGWLDRMTSRLLLWNSLPTQTLLNWPAVGLGFSGCEMTSRWRHCCWTYVVSVCGSVCVCVCLTDWWQATAVVDNLVTLCAGCCVNSSLSLLQWNITSSSHFTVASVVPYSCSLLRYFTWCTGALSGRWKRRTREWRTGFAGYNHAL